MFKKADNNGFTSPVEGINVKTISFGEKTLMAEFRLEKDADLPEHTHPHEQTGYLVSGKIILNIGEESHTVNPGDSWCIGGDVPHSAKIIEDSVAIEVFSPVREDLLP